MGCAREQKGHWKSANSTIVTGAVRLPQVGSLGSIGTPASASGEVTGGAATTGALGETAGGGA